MKNNITFLNVFKPLLFVLLFAVLGLILHKGFFYFFVPKHAEGNFIYDIPALYGVFTVFSFSIVLILLKIKQKNMDIVGYGFLILTSVKMVAAYLFLKPILHESYPESQTEKISFFIIFCYFLAIETVVTIRILNDKI